MAKVVIDGITYDVNPDNNLLQECLSQGLDLPYFCWHPCMGSVGACRQCAVKQYRDEKDENGMLVMACMTPATDGAIISIEDEQAKSMRASVIESLMISHPHDCPVCEEGGECHLQDMTLMSGHNYRRFDKDKVTHNNQYLGPFINHEMNRCITCYRCVRYYDDYAGGTDLSAQASHHHVYFGRHEEGTLESEFSGNLVEVCPTGVFTDKSFSERYSRKWDLQVAPSVCTGCSVGCNTSPGERYGELRRIVNRYNSEVNGYFLCDRGRFGFDYVNSEDRIKSPFKRNRDGSEWVEGVEQGDVRAQLTNLKKSDLVGIGSPRASNESNYALRCMVGEENFYSGLSDSEHESVQIVLDALKDPAFHSPSIKEIEEADAILILNEDVTNTAPRIALALRQAVRQKAFELANENNIPSWQDAAVRELAQHELSPLTSLSTYATRLADVASHSVVAGSEKLLVLGEAISAGLGNTSSLQASLSDEDKALVDQVVSELSEASNPLIIAGTAASDPQTIKLAANIARALESKNSKPTNLGLIVPEVNTLGVGLLAGREQALSAALERLSSGNCKNVVILENDLFRRAPTNVVNTALDAAESVVVMDQLPNATTAKGTLVLPSTAFSEHEGTYLNYEGRAQLSYQVNRCHSDAVPAWRWLVESSITHINELINQCADQTPEFRTLASVLPELDGLEGLKVPRQSHRYSGRTAMKANINVHEPKQAVDEESVMSFSMEGIPSMKNSNILASTWAPKWNSNQSISKFQEEVNGELKQGHTGSLIIEKLSETGAFYAIEQTKTSSESGMEVCFATQIFGSDELSANSRPIQERMVNSYLGLNVSDAEKLGIKQGELASISGSQAKVLVCVRKQQAAGTVSLYCSPGEINPHDVAETIEISKSTDKIDSNNSVSLDGLLLSDLAEEA